MTKRQALGKGLEALLRSAQDESRFLELPLESIKPNPYQPRKEFSEGELTELAESIKARGVLQPVLVCEKAVGEYELIAGERRVRAAKIAGLKTIPAILIEAKNPTEVLALALIENLQREDLNPIEQAESFKTMSESFGLTQDEIARLVGKSRVAITNTMRLLKLPEEVKNLLREGKLTEGHARALLSANDPNLQVHLANLVVKRGLTVERTEILASSIAKERKKSKLKKTKTPELVALEQELTLELGTKVVVDKRGREGRIIISFYSDEELQRILEILIPGK